MKKYIFRDVAICEMCSEETSSHKILGQRLNKSQGLNPKSKNGITISIMQCANCGLIYSNPQPIPYSLQDHYGYPPEDYWKPEYFSWNPAYFSIQIEEVKKLLDFKKGMCALDIGAGLGKAMLSLEHAGFDAYGLEPSQPFYERAISKMNIPKEKLKFGPVEDIDYEKHSFDLITFGAVFEHLFEPASCLEKVLSWLKPNGIIHIEVPSSNWLLPKFINTFYKLRGTNYVTNLSPMHAPFHLHEFSLKSFHLLSKKLNYQIVSHRYDVCQIYYFPKIFHSILKLYMQKTNTGMQLTLYLKKVDS